MIRKLQLRFIWVSMGTLLLVLATILTAINIVNYHGVVSQADQVLGLISENSAPFADFNRQKPHRPMPEKLSPELPFESRYFTVDMDSSGNILKLDLGHIAAVDETLAAEYAQAVWKRQKGFRENFRFLVKTTDTGTELFFLDCGRQLESFYRFLWASIGISFLGYCLVWLLVTVLSSRIIRPIALSYEKQKRFITDAGHELKTPVTIIRADTDVLQMELGENEWLEDIRKQTDRLTALTGDLVLLARMEEAKNSVQKIDFPLSDTVLEAAQSFQAPAQTQGKDFTLRIQPMLSMKGDPKAITQLVNILLDNAMKYSKSQINLTLEKQSKQLRLRVSNDTLQSLEKQQLTLLFDRFYQADASRNSQGHGIGLSVAQAIVTTHGGKLRAELPEENKLVFTATFPVSTNP